MTVYIGSNELKKAYIGSQEIKQIRVGDKRVFPKGYTPNANTLMYFSFDNSNLNDSSGNGKNGTRYNGTGSFIDGISGKAANMGNSHAITLSRTLFPTGDFTLSLRVYFINAAIKGIQSFGGTVEWTTTQEIHFHYIYTSSDRGLTFSFAGQQNSFFRYSNRLPNNNQWYNIIVTRIGNAWKMYLDAVQVASCSINFTPNQSRQWYLGKEYTDDRYIDGYLDEIILENRGRSQQEITNYFNLVKG